jgi:hypothetical protein
MSSRDMCLLPRATLHSDSEQVLLMKKNGGGKSHATVPLTHEPNTLPKHIHPNIFTCTHSPGHTVGIHLNRIT